MISLPHKAFHLFRHKSRHLVESNAGLLHRIALADGDSLVFQRLRVDGDAELSYFSAASNNKINECDELRIT